MGATTDTNRRGINSTETTVQSVQAFKDAKGGSKYITRNRRGQEVLEAALSKEQLKRVEWGSISLGVLDAQRFGEWDAPHPRPEPNKALLLPKKLKQYNKPPASKSISTLVPADSNRDEFLRKSIAAFAEGVKNLGES